MIRLSFKNKLLISTLLIFSTFAVSFIIYQQRREKAYKIALLNQKLQDYNLHLGETILLSLPDEVEIDQFIANHSIPSLRVTIIGPQGSVLYDNLTKDYASLGDHGNRKEILQAKATGSGYVLDRKSSTMDMDYFYSATLIPMTGLIIRTALPYDSDLTRSLKADRHFLWFSLWIIALLALVLQWYMRMTGNSIIRRQIRHNEIVRKELTQNISHELRTPVASILGYLETILNTPNIPPETLRSFHERCYAQTQRLSALLQDISTLNKLDESPQMPVFEALDIAQIIDTIVNETALSFRQKNMRLDLSVPETIPATGNAVLIYGIFRNLTDNALFYAGEGSTVRIEATDLGKEWRFVFEDNGPGVPKEELPHLFERFYRLDKGRSRRLGGTGLGLAIVKNSVLVHGGKISVRNASPSGLRFEFTLKK